MYVYIHIYVSVYISCIHTIYVHLSVTYLSIYHLSIYPSILCMHLSTMRERERDWEQKWVILYPCPPDRSLHFHPQVVLILT